MLTVALLVVSRAGQVKDDDPDKKGYPGPTRLVAGRETDRFIEKTLKDTSDRTAKQKTTWL